MPDDSLFVEVLLDRNLAKPLDYRVPSHWQKEIQVGARVEVPLKKGSAKGTIATVKSQSAWPDPRPITTLLSPQAELSPIQWKLAEWMSEYYATALQKVLKCFIPSHIRREVAPKKQLWVSLLKTRDEIAKICQTSHSPILEKLLQTKKGLYFSELHVPKSALTPLLKQKLIEIRAISSSEDLMLEEEFFSTKPKTLHAEQQACFDAIVTSLNQNRFAAHLIHGVTGSGKTEIYLQAIQRAREQNKGALLLVPEISLTSQTIERFRSRFPEKIAILHHRRSLGERSQAWEELRAGKIHLAIGARSALFCPIQNLGLIIVDEEHDGSYKQHEEPPCYQARDVAVMRAYLENSTILLGSATPSLESRYNAELGKYQLHILRSRATEALLPQVQIVDMKRALEINGGFTHFSQELLDAIREKTHKGEQTLLFLNRRGYHRMQMCGLCRSVVKCPHCDLSLTFHREHHHLRCHLCDYHSPPHRKCPSCSSAEKLDFKGFGTEHVERSLHALFPEIRTLRMDRDTTQQKNSHEELFKQFRAHKADVLIGTQMIAKGFHFPAVTLVGILNPDSSLTIPDFRAPEQLFQILTQVAGRAGRANLPGQVILQTFFPDHPLLQLAATQDYDAFYQTALAERRQFSYPPFCHLIKLLFTSPDPQEAETLATAAHTQVTLHLPQDTLLLPVVPSGHAKIKDLYRFQFLIKTNRVKPVVSILTSLNLKAKIDVDPVSTFF